MLVTGVGIEDDPSNQAAEVDDPAPGPASTSPVAPAGSLPTEPSGEPAGPPVNEICARAIRYGVLFPPQERLLEELAGAAAVPPVDGAAARAIEQIDDYRANHLRPAMDALADLGQVAPELRGQVGVLRDYLILGIRRLDAIEQPDAIGEAFRELSASPEQIAASEAYADVLAVTSRECGPEET